MSVALGLGIWIAVSAALAPLVGNYLCGRRIEKWPNSAANLNSRPPTETSYRPQ